MKRFVSLILSMCMVLTILPITLFAEEETPAPSAETPAEDNIVLEQTVSTEPEGSADEPVLPEDEEPMVETLSGTVIASGVCGDDLSWALDDAGTLTISGDGYMYDYTSETAPWYEYRDSITSLVLESGFLFVPEGPFQSLSALTTVSLSDTVEEIDWYAFSNCPSLTMFEVDADNAELCAVDGVLMTNEDYPYLICYPAAKADTAYTVLDGTWGIMHCAFDDVSALTIISLPASLLQLSNGTFSECPNLSQIHYAGTEALWDIITPDGLISNASITFGTADMTGSCGTSATFTFNAESGALTISGKGKTEFVPWPTEYVRTVFIGPDLTGFSSRHYNYPLLESVTVDPANENLISINGVLYGYDADAEEVTSILRYPAQKTDTTFTVPDTVTAISYGTFANCVYLQGLFIPASVSYIETFSFIGETSLDAITVDSENAYYSSVNNVLLYHDHTLVHYPASKSDASYSIPNGTTVLDQGVFGVCPALTELYIPFSIGRLDPGVFQYLPNLETIIFEGSEDDLANLPGGKLLANYTDAVITFENKTTFTGMCGDNATYTLDLDAGTLVISGSGAIYDYDSNTAPWQNKNVQSIVIESGITAIGNNAFRELPTVKTLSLADTITAIGTHVFWGCEGLTTLVLPSQLETIGFCAFGYCTGLQTVYIPASVKSVDSWAFRYCSSLIAFSVDSGNTAYCAVDGVLLNKAQTILRCYPVGSANTSYTVPDGVTSINAYAFSGANNLTSVELPISLKTISSSAFSDCENLTTVSYAGTETLWSYVSVGSNNDPLLNATFTFGTASTVSGQCGDDATFTLDLDTGALVISGTGEVDNSDEWVDYVELVTSLTVEGGITEIWEDAFYDLINLTALSLPETVTYIDHTVLNTECPSLTTIAVHADNTAFCAVDNVLFSKDMTSLLVYPTGKSGAVYTVPATVTEIALCAFYNNSALTTLSLPAGLQTFLSQSIYKCSNLQNILLDSSNTNFVCDSNVALIEGDTLLFYCPGNLQSSYTVPDEVALIDAYAFYGTANLQTISLPLSLEEVGGFAFSGAKGLETVIYPGTEAYWNYSVSVVTKGNSTLTGAEYTFGTIDTISGTTIDGLAWTMELTPGKLTISGTGDMSKRGSWPRDYIQTVVLEEGITSIAPSTFSDATLLKEVTIPASVTTIETDAFSNCSALETVYYGGSEPQWGLVSIAAGNLRLQMAKHIYDSYLLVEWNSDHTVLSLSGMVTDSAYVTAAFYDAKGQMQLVKHYTADQVVFGVGISSDTVDLTQSTAKVMVVDESHAPLGMPYTPDAQKYDYVAAWFYATEHAYIDGGQFADAGTLLFSDDKTVYTASTDILSLELWELGVEYLLTIDPATKEVLCAEESGRAVAGQCTQRVLDYKSKTVYIGDVEGTLANDAVPCLTLNAACTGVPGTMDLTTLKSLAGIATSDEYRAVDKDADGEIDYLLVRPYLYGMVEKSGAHAKYGEYITLTDPTDNTLLDPINNGTNWYLSDITDLDDLPNEGSILKMSWNLKKDIYEVEILDSVVAEFTKCSSKGTYTFDGTKYYLADNGWITSDDLPSSLFGEFFALTTDGEFLVYAEISEVEPLDAAELYNDGADIDEDAKNAVELLYALDIMLGDASGNFNPNSTITKAEVAKMVYVILNYGQDDQAVNYKGASIFSDVESGAWYEGYVNYCAMIKLTAGNGDGTFGPTDAITCAEAARFLLCAIGYSAETRGYYDTNWENNVLADAGIIGLLENYNASTTDVAPRQWFAVMVENMLTKAYTYKTLPSDMGNGLLTGGSLMGEKYFALTEDSLIYRRVYTDKADSSSSTSTTLRGTIQAAQTMAFSSSLTALQELGGNDNEYIVFTSLPAGGKLVYNWGTSAPETVTVGTEYYLSAVSGEKLMTNVTFVPNYSADKTQKTLAFDVKGYNAKDKSVNGIINITVNHATTSAKFTDVTDSMYADSVDFLYNEGITTGMTATTFGLNNNVTRAQFIIFLYRAAGNPAFSGDANPFADVSSSGSFAYAYNPIRWAVQNGIIDPADPDLSTVDGELYFQPDAVITHESMLVYLYRFDTMVWGNTITPGSSDSITDYNSVDAYAQPAVLWAVGKGVLTEDCVLPETSGTRATMSLWLHRAMTL